MQTSQIALVALICQYLGLLQNVRSVPEVSKLHHSPPHEARRSYTSTWGFTGAGLGWKFSEEVWHSKPPTQSGVKKGGDR